MIVNKNNKTTETNKKLCQVIYSSNLYKYGLNNIFPSNYEVEVVFDLGYEYNSNPINITGKNDAVET